MSIDYLEKIKEIANKYQEDLDQAREKVKIWNEKDSLIKEALREIVDTLKTLDRFKSIEIKEVGEGIKKYFLVSNPLNLLENKKETSIYITFQLNNKSLVEILFLPHSNPDEKMNHQLIEVFHPEKLSKEYIFEIVYNAMKHNENRSLLSSAR